MFRTLTMFTFLVLLISGHALPARPPADANADKEKQIADLAKKYLYPDGKSFSVYNNGTIYQSVLTTPDDLDKVDKWYRKALSILPTDGTGVSSQTRIIDVDTPKERGFDVRRSLYADDQKLKGDNSKQKVSQPATVRSYIVKEAEYTLVVVATRPKDEKESRISVTFIPEVIK